MIRSRLGLKALVLSGLVLGLMAFAGSSVAQAETGAKWCWINTGTKVLECATASLEPIVQSKTDPESKEKLSLLFTTAGGTKVEINCTALELAGSPKLTLNGGLTEGKAKFTGCKTFLNGAESKNCEPKTTGTAKGTVETKTAKGLITLHLLTAGGAVDTTVLITPTTKNGKGETSAALLEMGELCAIGELVEITGDLTIVECKGEFAVHKVEHLIAEASFLRGLKALGQPAQVDGSVMAFLTGAHAGYAFAGLPSTTKP
jgi:hypothetical protein